MVEPLLSPGEFCILIYQLVGLKGRIRKTVTTLVALKGLMRCLRGYKLGWVPSLDTFRHFQGTSDDFKTSKPHFCRFSDGTSASWHIYIKSRSSLPGPQPTCVAGLHSSPSKCINLLIPTAASLHTIYFILRQPIQAGWVV